MPQQFAKDVDHAMRGRRWFEHTFFGHKLRQAQEQSRYQFYCRFANVLTFAEFPRRITTFGDSTVVTPAPSSRRQHKFDNIRKFSERSHSRNAPRQTCEPPAALVSRSVAPVLSPRS